MGLPIAPPELEGLVHIGGMDEVGRGCFAGPVVSALVILPQDFKCDLINDSKKLSDKQRRVAYDIILKEALDYSVESVSVKKINKIGIDPSTFLSMQKCIDSITILPEYLLIDGNRWDSYKNIEFQTVVKGDSTYMSIAAASIVAKVRRDDYMIELSKLYPEYNWENNKGYFCKKHQAALKEVGPTDYHRTLFVRNWV